MGGKEMSRESLVFGWLKGEEGQGRRVKSEEQQGAFGTLALVV